MGLPLCLSHLLLFSVIARLCVTLLLSSFALSCISKALTSVSFTMCPPSWRLCSFSYPLLSNSNFLLKLCCPYIISIFVASCANSMTFEAPSVSNTIFWLLKATVSLCSFLKDHLSLRGILDSTKSCSCFFSIFSKALSPLCTTLAESHSILRKTGQAERHACNIDQRVYVHIISWNYTYIRGLRPTAGQQGVQWQVAGANR